ncbi:FMN-binding negative transcriptional regulator [Halovulum dunhuangense]|uniref:FMN-binding negative transcriptional regulator n=1 Tax=Halovulum dunhuangense TaxID=1505036 RepID=A0A849KUL3_9RHOB|nr:FMN-binding negative transcriptional regulator [Halovulum dunhuangense]NNU78998.1 FMN-binding negative transcriptional regulator [Halovulum dunhuangense]
MHPNPAFRRTAGARNIAFVRARSFGILTLAGPDGPLAAHIPFVLNPEGTALEAHLVRSNPIWAAIAEPVPALMIVSGPDGYVSPDWYGMENQVPTWNYVAVHLRGTLHRQDVEALAPHAAELSAQFEGRLLPKKPWTEDKMDPEALARMRRMIVPLRMEIAAIDGTWKLNQNKPEAARLAAADAIAGSGIGSELETLAALMRDPPATE